MSQVVQRSDCEPAAFYSFFRNNTVTCRHKKLDFLDRKGSGSIKGTVVAGRGRAAAADSFHLIDAAAPPVCLFLVRSSRKEMIRFMHGNTSVLERLLIRFV
jgi:hypothetical protein